MAALTFFMLVVSSVMAFGATTNTVDGSASGSSLHAGANSPASQAGPDSWKALVAISIFIGGVMWVMVLGFGGSRRIPPTHETTGLLHVLVIFHVALMTIYLTHAVIYLQMGSQGSATSYAYSLAVVLLLAATVAVVVPFIVPVAQGRWLRAHSCATEKASALVTVVRPLLSELAEGMRCAIPIDIGITEETNCSPAVQGTPWAATIVIPSNFDDMCVRACSGDSHEQDALMRMILSHEVSHITAGDLLITPLLWSYCLATSFAAAGVFSIYALLSRSPCADITAPLVTLLTVAAVLGLLLRLRVARARESLADAAATLSITPQVIDQLVLPRTDGRPSPLDAFLLMASVGCLRIPAPRFSYGRLPRWVARLGLTSAATGQMSHATPRLRGKAIHERQYVVPHAPGHLVLTTSTAAVLAAFTWWLCARTKVALMLLGTPRNTVMGDWLRYAFEMDWSIHASLLSSVFWTLTPVLSAVVAVVSMLLPYRDAMFDGIRVRRLDLAKALAVSLVMSLLSSVVLASLSSQLVTPLFRTPNLSPSTLPAGLSLFVACALFLCAVSVKWAPLLRSLRRLARRLVPMLVMLCLPLVLVIACCRNIPVMARVIVFLVSAMITGIPSCAIPNKTLCRDFHLATEWIEYDRIIRWRRVRLKAPTDLDTFDFSDMLSSFVRGAVTYTFPIVAVSAVTYPLLRYLANETSGLWLGVLLLSITLAFFGAVLLGVYHSAADEFGVLTYYPALASLLPPLELTNLRKSYTGRVLELVSSERPYLHGPEHVPRMRGTCEALRLSGEDIPLPLREAMVAWIASCRAPQGGYGYAPGTPADPLHTYHALAALGQVRPLPRDDVAKHREWAAMTLGDLMKCRGKIPSSTCLRHAALLVSSLELLPAPVASSCGLVSDDELIRMAGECWNLSACSVDDASDMVTIASGCLSAQARDIIERIRSHHLPRYESALIRSDPKSSLGDIQSLQNIEQVLYPDTFTTRAAMRQICDNISKSAFLRGSSA